MDDNVAKEGDLVSWMGVNGPVEGLVCTGEDGSLVVFTDKVHSMDLNSINKSKYFKVLKHLK